MMQKRLNNKGFMMAEVVVVSAVILIAMTTFYVSYNKIISLYDERINYYDVATLYELASIRDSKSSYSSYSSKTAIIKETYKKVYYLDSDDLGSLRVSNQTFKDYLKYIEGSVKFKTGYVLVMENCLNEDINNCRYAYLDVYNY